MTTDFMTELNTVTRTKEEVERNKQLSQLEKEKEWRYKIKSYIKSSIKSKASSGDFIDVETKKQISGIIESIGNIITVGTMRYETYTKTMSRGKGFGILAKPKREVKIVATPWFLGQIKLMEQEMIQEGLEKIKIQNAIYFEGEYRVADEIISLTDKYEFCRGGHIYYEIEY